MKKVVGIFLLCLMLVSCYGVDPQVEKGVKLRFQDYQGISDSTRAEAMADIFSSGTIAYYNGLVRDSLRLAKVKLLELPIGDQIQILQIRAAYDKDVLARMDGGGLIKQLTATGQVASASIDNVWIEGDEAIADFYVNSVESEFKFGFKKEKETWKIDLLYLLNQQNEKYKALIDKGSLTMGDMAKAILSAKKTKVDSVSIFEPLIE